MFGAIIGVLAIVIIAAILAFTGIAKGLAAVAKIIFYIFLTFSIIGLIIAAVS